jgi:hypothetical protein
LRFHFVLMVTAAARVLLCTGRVQFKVALRRSWK